MFRKTIKLKMGFGERLWNAPCWMHDLIFALTGYKVVQSSMSGKNGYEVVGYFLGKARK